MVERNRKKLGGAVSSSAAMDSPRACTPARSGGRSQLPTAPRTGNFLKDFQKCLVLSRGGSPGRPTPGLSHLGAARRSPISPPRGLAVAQLARLLIRSPLESAVRTHPVCSEYGIASWVLHWYCITVGLTWSVMCSRYALKPYEGNVGSTRTPYGVPRTALRLRDVTNRVLGPR